MHHEIGIKRLFDKYEQSRLSPDAKGQQTGTEWLAMSLDMIPIFAECHKRQATYKLLLVSIETTQKSGWCGSL